MVILLDSSAWIEYFRKTMSPVDVLATAAIQADTAATTDAVILEVLAGAPKEHISSVERLLNTRHYVAQEPLTDAEFAVGLYRQCRARGVTPRAVNDCLIAAVAIRNDVPVLHRDKDFDVIAKYTDLRLVPS
jgi:predicted nucleic acid-binding protein